MWIRKDTVTFHLNSMKIMMMTCFCGMVDRRKVLPYFQPRPVSKIPTIANLWHPVSRVWTCAEPGLRPWWMRLCSSDNQYTTVQLYIWNVKTPRQCKSLKNTILSFLNVNSACWSRDMLNFDFLEKVFSRQHMLETRKIFSCYTLLSGQILLFDSFTSWNIGQYVFCHYLFCHLWHHKIWN